MADMLNIIPLEFMTRDEVVKSAMRGASIAVDLRPLTGETFRFPFAVRHTARRLGHKRAAVQALVIAKGDAPGDFDAALSYVHRVDINPTYAYARAFDPLG